jgi:hypothetical protein
MCRIKPLWRQHCCGLAVFCCGNSRRSWFETSGFAAPLRIRCAPTAMRPILFLATQEKLRADRTGGRDFRPGASSSGLTPPTAPSPRSFLRTKLAEAHAGLVAIRKLHSRSFKGLSD